MKKILFIEPSIFLSAFALSLISPLTTQYIYQRIWKETSNYSYIDNSNISECEANKSNPIYEIQKEVQKKASLFSLQMDLSGLIPGIVVTFILLSSSDQKGRKGPLILSSIGALANSICLCLLAYLGLPIQLLIASTLISAFCGNSTTFLGGCFAYIIDQCKEEKQKTIRIAIIDLIIGLVTGLTGLSSGYFIKELGFVWSYFITSLALAINLIYIVFFLEDPISVSSSWDSSMSWSKNFKKLFLRAYMLFKNVPGKQRTLLCLLLFTMITYFFVVIGSSPIFILYELNSPLCWNEVFIGYGSSLASISFLTSFLGIWIFSYCLKDVYIVFIGIFTTTGGMALAAFAKTTLMMLLVRIPFLFTFMPLSVLRSMLSKVVSSTEQGTLFACIAFLETLVGVIAVSTFNGIYSATVAWFSGFTFMFSAGLLLIPGISLCVIMCTRWEEEDRALLIQEESREDNIVN
ncbi:solute carrier family 46 member 3 isoform X1 [Trichosurus vulpecula]|uniref:solute carrier family 46 member 3 isoform X1 n=2 Tax=Trichosurus vulpecula TaxID=9337 RepID=UPI00186ADB7D|nr:solute carrier family 46 member 3 isoform X1 [Trichosurus vulpecula]XP_036602905.1 solute carrier family 46 member 3 isoform X1 [Trichosurus vulpecula]